MQTNTHKGSRTQNRHLGTFTTTIETIITSFSLSNCLEIRNIKAQILLEVPQFQFLYCSISIFFDKIYVLLIRNSNFAFFHTFVLPHGSTWARVIHFHLKTTTIAIFPCINGTRLRWPSKDSWQEKIFPIPNFC